MYSSIVKVTLIVEKYHLELLFNDGQTRILDMTPYLDFGVFSRIKKQEEFNRVHVAFDTIEWDCGVDLDPEFVMIKSTPVSY